MSVPRLSCRLIPPRPVCMRFTFAKQRTLSSRCGGDRASRIVINHLRINMFPGKMNCQARPLRRACNFFSDPSMNALPRCLTKSSPCLLNGLAYLATNLLACVANTFALVRFRRIKTADIGCDLAH